MVRGLLASFTAGLALAVVACGGILADRLSLGDVKVATVAHVVLTIAVIGLVHAQRRSIDAHRLGAQMAGAAVGIMLAHAVIQSAAIGAAPWLDERPGQLVNDAVAVFAPLAIVWASTRRPPSTVVLVGTLLLVTVYRATGSMWHLDAAPFVYSVQDLVTGEARGLRDRHHRVRLLTPGVITHIDMIASPPAPCLAASSATSATSTGARSDSRTHLIVAMTAATFMVLSSQFVYWQHYGKDDLVGVDASRIAASVVSGIGFLAGGAILDRSHGSGSHHRGGSLARHRDRNVRGAGMYVEGFVVTALGLIALTVLRRFEDKNVERRRVSVVLGAEAVGIEPVAEALRSLGASVVEVEYERHLEDEQRKIVVTIDVQLSESVPNPEAPRGPRGRPGIRRVHVQNHG